MTEPGGLSVDNLTVERGGRAVLGGVSFHVAEGDALQVTGRNGAGKSTLLRALCGLLPLRAGRVTFRHRGLANPNPELQSATHYLGHADGLKRALTAVANLRFFQAWAGSTDVTPEQALARLGIGHLAELPVAFLSAGQRRRVALARLLVSRRPIWLIDEPTTALDAEAETILGEALQSHLREGGLVVAATHAPLPIAARSLRLGPA